MGKLGFDPLQLVNYVVDDVSRLQMFGQDIPCIDFDLDLGHSYLDLGRQACLLLPEENANPECGQPTIFQISHHWGIARPNCPGGVGRRACHSGLAFVHGGRPVDWRFSIDGHIRTVAVNGRFSATNAEALREATLAGYGIARLATFLISDDLRSARLVPILHEFSAEGPAVRAVYPSSRHLSPKVRSFIDELLTAWRPEPPWIGRDHKCLRLDPFRP